MRSPRTNSPLTPASRLQTTKFRALSKSRKRSYRRVAPARYSRRICARVLGQSRRSRGDPTITRLSDLPFAPYRVSRHKEQAQNSLANEPEMGSERRSDETTNQ